MDPILSAVQQNLDSALSVPFVSSSVVLGLAFYAYKAAPELPSFVEELFENLFFKIFVGFLVLYMSTGNFMLSIVVSGVFIYSLDMLKENFNVLGADYVSGDRNINQNGGGNCDDRDLLNQIKGFPGNYVNKNWIDRDYRDKYTDDQLRDCVKAAGKTPYF
jgi:hypothetical protein